MMREANIDYTRTINRIKRRKHNDYKKRAKAMIIGMICVFTVMLVIAFGRLVPASAGEATSNEKLYKYYTTVSIEKNDTLWSIAEAYADDNTSIPEYIREMKELNNITSNDIYEGQNILVYYYSPEYK